MSKKVLFVYNAHAGQERIRFALVDVLDIFQKADYEVTVHPTQAKGDASEWVKINECLLFGAGKNIRVFFETDIIILWSGKKFGFIQSLACIC